MKIGERIFNIRKGQDMTQQEFASVFSVTKRKVSNWEKEKSYPDLQILVDMSDQFEVSLDRMLKDDAKMVKRIDKERKFSKYVKRGAVILGGILMVFCVIWSILWYDTKNEVEKRFQDGVEQFGFQDYVPEKDEDMWAESQYSHRLEEGGGVTFFLGHLMMSEWNNILYLGCYNQILRCRVQREDDLLEIQWCGPEAGSVEIYIYDGTGKHCMEEQAAKKLLRDDEQMKQIDDKAHEMCSVLYMDYKWLRG